MWWFIPPTMEMAGWGLLLIIPAYHMGAFLPLPKKASSWLRLRKFVSISMLICGAVLLVNMVSGGKDLMAPLTRPNQDESSRGAKVLPFERVRSVAELEARIKAAGKPVMLDFYADWCVSCKEMEAYTFSNDAVKLKLDGFLLLQVDVTANTAEHKALLKRFSLFGPPGIIFFDSQGREIKGLRVIGYQNSARFLKTLSLATAP